MAVHASRCDCWSRRDRREQSARSPSLCSRREVSDASRRLCVALAPEPYLSACLETVYFAVTQARHVGLTGRRSGISIGDAARLDDLIDAIHNLPRLVRRWNSWTRNGFAPPWVA